MDALESGFDRIAERSCMSSNTTSARGGLANNTQCSRHHVWHYHGGVVGRLSISGRPFGLMSFPSLVVSDADEQAFQELAENLRDLEGKKADSEAVFNEERRALKAEIDHLKEQLRSASSEHEQTERFERELRQARVQIDSEVTARRISEERHQDLLSNVERQRQELSEALAEATSQTKASGGSPAAIGAGP
jgi:hypothetical protein